MLQSQNHGISLGLSVSASPSLSFLLSLEVIAYIDFDCSRSNKLNSLFVIINEVGLFEATNDYDVILFHCKSCTFAKAMNRFNANCEIVILFYHSRIRLYVRYYGHNFNFDLVGIL